MLKPDDTADVVTLLEPATAAKRLGVSASGLRRLAPIYESVHDELPRKGSGAEDKRARLWPEEAIERLQDARRLVELERNRTILEALRALQSGVSVEELEVEPIGRQAGSDVATQQALHKLLEEMQALRYEVAELRQREITPPKKESEHGALVQMALWLEQTLRRFGG